MLSHFLEGEMGNLVHYYHVAVVFGAVSVQERHHLSVGLLLCPSVICI